MVTKLIYILAIAWSGMSLWTEVITQSGVWVHEGYFSNTVALRLDPESFLVISPKKEIIKSEFKYLFQECSKIFVLAPNHFHHLGIDQFHDYYPSACLICSDIAFERLRFHVKSPLYRLKDLNYEFPSHIKFLIPEGLRDGEVWVEYHVGPEKILIIGDSFINFTHKIGGVLGVVVKLCKATPNLQISRTFDWFHVSNLSKYKEWTKQYFDGNNLEWIVPMHGSVLHGINLSRQIMQAIERRLGPVDVTNLDKAR